VNKALPAASVAPIGDAPLRVERDARGVYRLTLDRPANFNALSEDMLEALLLALQRVAADEQARFVVIGAVGKAFCPGHNLKEMAAHPTLEFYQRLFGLSNQVMLGLVNLPVPVLARVQGLATAAGCQLVAQCDLAVASSEARFATSGINMGLFCATPSVPLLRNMPAKQAMAMLLTGQFIDAQEALAHGLVNRVVAPEALDAAVEEMVAAVLAKPRHAVAVGKALFYRQRELGLAGAYQLASQTMALNMMDPAAQEGARAFVEKRPPSWPDAELVRK
jgi:enoyl-CoA hydratase/carnithine racemase